MILIYIALGVLAGTITGLAPGIHVNLVATVLPSIIIFLNISRTNAAIFVFSVAITHIIIDFIPSTLLGAPDPDSALIVMPAHALLMKGEGIRAIQLGIGGCLLAIFIGSILTVLSFPIIPIIQPYLQPAIPFIVLAAVLFLTLKESQRLWSIFIFLSSGILGYVALRSDIQDPLAALFSGAFGIAGLLISLEESSIIPIQREESEILVSDSDGIKSVCSASIVGILTGFLPGIGSSQGMMLISSILKRTDEITYLIAIGGVSMVNFVFSLSTWYSLNKARNGVVVMLQSLFGTIDMQTIISFIGVCLIAAGMASIIALFLIRPCIYLFQKLNYQLISISVIIFITLLVFILCSWQGLFILLLSTAIGLVANVTGVHKAHIMGCLLLPYLLGVFGAYFVG